VKLLLIDDNRDRAGKLAAVLARDSAVEVMLCPPGMALAEAVAALAPDVVLIDMARPDRDALEGIRRISAADPRPIALFIDHDDPVFMEEAISAGVSSYNVLGTPPEDLKPLLRAAVSIFRRHRTAEQKLHRTAAELQERQTIDRAKTLLMRNRQLTEPQAHRYLQRQAMAQGRRIADIAADIAADPPITPLAKKVFIP
jgi:response regulator NasT